MLDDRYNANHDNNDIAPSTTRNHSEVEGQGSQPLASQSNDGDDTLVVCRCETPKILYDLLQSFTKHGSWSRNSANSSGTQSEEGATLNKLHPMTIFCTKSGLTIHSQSNNKQFQASMELPSSLFRHYRLMEPKDGEDNDDEVSYDFTIHWQTFMQCLNVLMIGTGGDKIPTSSASASFFRNHHQTTVPPSHLLSSLTMSYHTSTEVLRLEWEGSDSNCDGNVVATAAIPGLNPPPADEAAELSAAFGQSPIAARWLCPQAGHELSDTKELDYIQGATTVRLRFLRAGECTARDKIDEDNGMESGPRLRLSSTGHSGRVTIEIPAPIEFSEERVTKIAHTYSLAGWKRALQPLDMAQETCLSVNTRGILAIQHQLVVDTAGNRSKKKRLSYGDSTSHSQQQKAPQPPSSMESAFCDFLLLPLEVDEEQDNDDDSDLSDNDDDRQISTQGSLSQAIQSSPGDDDEEDIRLSATRGDRQRRRILSATQDSNDSLGRNNDAETTNATVRLPIGSDDEEEENERHNEASSTGRMNLLFPTVTDGADAGSTNSSNHRNRRLERERRKRQRRSNQLSNLSSSILSAQQNDAERNSFELDNEHDEEDDDSKCDEDNRNRNHDEDNDARYCSSPELVYGQQG